MLGAYLLCTLHIDVESDHTTRGKRRKNGRTRRAIPGTTKDLRVLKELVLIDHPLEARLIDEVVVAAIKLARSRGTRGCGNAEITVESSHDLMHDGGLADARRSTHDEQKAMARAFHFVSVRTVISVMLPN